MTVAGWLFNPFIRIGGGQALAIGLTAIVLSGLAAAAADMHFSGLLDFRGVSPAPYWVPVVEGLVNWSSISVILAAVSLLIAPRTVRLIDIAGTQALARAPLLPAALVVALPPVRDGNQELTEFARAALDGRMETPAPVSLVVGLTAGLLVIACVVWMVGLMWKAFSVSCNQRGGRAVAIFVGAIIVGQMATQSLLSRMFGSLMFAGVPGG